MLIDQTDTSVTTITLTADTATTDSSSSMQITSSDPSINMESDLTLEIQTLIPLEPLSNVVITIPTDFGITDGVIDSLTTLGTSMNTSPTWTYDDSTRTLTVEEFNSVAIQSLGFITMTIGPVVNPS